MPSCLFKLGFRALKLLIQRSSRSNLGAHGRIPSGVTGQVKLFKGLEFEIVRFKNRVFLSIFICAIKKSAFMHIAPTINRLY